MSPQPTTLHCPTCGNINPYTADVCLRCGLPLTPIREAMGKAGAAAQAVPPVEKPRPPAPPMPALAQWLKKGRDIGSQTATHQILIREAAKHAEEIASRFFARLQQKGIQGITLSKGNLAAHNASHGYYFVEKDLGEDAMATMAVRIDPSGSDLVVQWRHYNLPPRRTLVETLGMTAASFVYIVPFLPAGLLGAGAAQVAAWVIAMTKGISVYELQNSWGYYQSEASLISTIFGLVVGAVVFVLTVLVIYKGIKKWSRASSLRGFQGQASADFQMSIRGALEEAIDEAQLKHQILGGTDEKGEKARVI